jgi:S-adenosylmethionine hydrolase
VDRAARVITLLTDFGLADAYAGIMKGVILGIAPGALVVDLCHSVPPQDVRAGAFLLMAAYAYFPPGTIHVAVVDPGVGTTRRIVAARAGGYTFVGPDNGVLRWALDRAGGVGGAEAVVAVENPRYRLANVSRTFHGRDVMAPAAAHLAAGVSLEALGPVVAPGTLAGEPFPSPERRGKTAVAGRVVYVDHFGNCTTNLPEDAASISSAPGVSVEVAGRRVPLARAYGDVDPGQPLALTGSTGLLEIAVRDGNAARTLGIEVGNSVSLGER